MARRIQVAQLVRLMAVIGLLLGLGASMPARAQDDPPPAVLLILDGSGSMNATDDTGRPLIDLAKEALASIVRVLPAGEVDVGLRVYGHRTDNTDETVGCADSELVVPVGPLDAERMIDAIRAVRPSGFTPIGLSLNEAADDLAGFRTATVILVSDGEDTCAPPDPCEVAAGLVAQGIKVNTVGFYLEDGSAARGQLECIAEATGGTYRDADDDVDLAGVVGVFLREVPGIGNFHIPFNGSTDRSAAPLVPLSPSDGFVALETTIAAGEARWFAVDVPPGYVIDVFGDARGFVEVAIPEPGDTVVFTILDPDGRSVGVAGRFGLDRVDLGRFVAVDIDYLQTISVETERLIAPYEQFLEEPWMLEGLEYRGYDEASWNAEQRVKLRYERRGPLPSGTYLIGIAWESELEAATSFDYLVGIRPADTDLFSAPASLAGSTDPESPAPPPNLPAYDPWPFQNPDLDPVAELYAEGPIAPDETRWFSVDVQTDETLLVDALLNVPLGTALSDEDGLTIEIIDPLGNTATILHPGGTPTSGTISELTRYFGQGYELRPLVSAAARMPGPDSPPPGRYLVGVTWNSVATMTDAALELRIGTAQPEGMVEMAVPEPEAATTTAVEEEPSLTATTDMPALPNDSESSLVLIVAIGAFVAVVAAGAIWLARRR